jgi:hypothetical protein
MSSEILSNVVLICVKTTPVSVIIKLPNPECFFLHFHFKVDPSWQELIEDARSRKRLRYISRMSNLRSMVGPVGEINRYSNR